MTPFIETTKGRVILVAESKLTVSQGWGQREGWVANGYKKRTLGSNGNVHYPDTVVVSWLYMANWSNRRLEICAVSWIFIALQHSYKKRRGGGGGGEGRGGEGEGGEWRGEGRAEERREESTLRKFLVLMEHSIFLWIILDNENCSRIISYLMKNSLVPYKQLLWTQGKTVLISPSMEERPSEAT